LGGGISDGINFPPEEFFMKRKIPGGEVSRPVYI
jgi:hypothetical protein